MKWEQHGSVDGYHRLKVEADWSELAAEYDDIVDSYAKVRVPGFRPGKTPRSVVEQRFQNEISDDLSHSAVQRFGIQAVREAGTPGPGSRAGRRDRVRQRPGLPRRASFSAHAEDRPA